MCFSLGVTGYRAATCQSGSENLPLTTPSSPDVMLRAAPLCSGDGTSYTLSQGVIWKDEKSNYFLELFFLLNIVDLQCCVSGVHQSIYICMYVCVCVCVCVYVLYTHTHTNIYISEYICVCVCFVAQSCLILCYSLDSSSTGSSVHGIFQARILEWVAMHSSRGSFWPRDRTCISCVSCIASELFTPWATAGGFITPWAIRGGMYIYIHTLFQILFHYKVLQDTENSTLSYILGFCYLYVLYKAVCIC